MVRMGACQASDPGSNRTAQRKINGQVEKVPVGAYFLQQYLSN